MIFPEPEVLRSPPDKRGAGAGLPREGNARLTPGVAPRRPALWNATTGDVFEPAAVFGAYPRGFLDFALRCVQCRASEVLHVCSGALGPDVAGVRVDIRRAAAPTVQADGRALPFRDACFAGVLVDPPYTVEYAADLYGTEYPRPSHLLKEAARVVRPGGRVGFLHFLVPMVERRHLLLERVHLVTQGMGYRVRGFSVFVRPPGGVVRLKREFGVVHGIAECRDCDWQTQSYKNAQANAARHARAHGHRVEGEVGYAYTYDGRGSARSGPKVEQ